VFSAFLRALARFVCDIPIFFALLLGLMRFAILVSQDCKITLGRAGLFFWWFDFFSGSFFVGAQFSVFFCVCTNVHTYVVWLRFLFEILSTFCGGILLSLRFCTVLLVRMQELLVFSLNFHLKFELESVTLAEYP
jgi:hypothetical protein